MNYLIINGPNLNLLGIREPDIYGEDSLKDIESWINQYYKKSSYSFVWFQSNHEGHIIDRIHQSMKQNIRGIIINPGAYTHYSYAIRDAILSSGIPTVEVHLSNIKNREEFRRISVLADVCISEISGLGKKSYLEGIKTLIDM
tara:strand:+ start:153 stop:581 length:429 start_codon:yes stop_codon:yes gene_type:complete